MYIGTTPTHIFTLPFTTDVIKCLRILYGQGNKLVLTKTTEDCTLEDKTIRVKLSQKETFLFNCTEAVKVQLRVLTNDGEALVSPINYVDPRECLEREELQ